MSDELKGIVETMLPILEEKVKATPSTFKLWFEDLDLISLNEDEAIFSTPTDLRRRILTSKFLGVIEDTLEEIIGFRVKVSFSCPDDEKKKLESEQAETEIIITDDQRREIEARENIIKSILTDNTSEKKSVLDEYTFANFIEGASNKFAKAACQAVAQSPASDFNPLFIHGNSGLGKTHLLCAVINYMKENSPDLKIVYKKCEDFMNELIHAISTFTTHEFKEKYRGADVLLIDDIQFIAGKVSTQEEFFHTFSYLYESNRQIILTSDRPPHEINPLEDRLRTRFEGGLIADIQPPSAELRSAIIKIKSKALGLTLEPSLVDYIASRLHENIRQIEGVIKKLSAIRIMSGEEITKEKIDEVISVIDPGNIPVDILIDKIISTVARFYGVNPADLKSSKRTDNVANARHVAIYITRCLTDKSYNEIGSIFSRDHSTVISSCDKVETNIKTKTNYGNDVNNLIKEIKGN